LGRLSGNKREKVRLDSGGDHIWVKGPNFGREGGELFTRRDDGRTADLQTPERKRGGKGAARREIEKGTMAGGNNFDFQTLRAKEI